MAHTTSKIKKIYGPTWITYTLFILLAILAISFYTLFVDSTQKPTRDPLSASQNSVTSQKMSDIDLIKSNFEQEIKKDFSNENILFSEMKLTTSEDNSVSTKDNSYVSFSATNNMSKFEVIQKQNLEGYTLKISTIGSDGKEKVVHSKTVSDTAVTSIYKIEHKDSIQYLLYDWSGGAHCCLTATPVRFDTKVQSIGKPNYIGYSEGLISDKNNFFEKNGDVYFYNYDTRYAYFEVSGSASKSSHFPTFFMLKNGTLIESNSEFKKYYNNLYNEAFGHTLNTIETYRGKELSELEQVKLYEKEFPILVFSYAVSRLSGTYTKEESTEQFELMYQSLFGTKNQNKETNSAKKVVSDLEIQPIIKSMENFFESKDTGYGYRPLK